MSGTIAPLTIESQPGIPESYGTPEYNRRLSDKILAAFNHAYATGERAIADKLWSVLVEIDGALAPEIKSQRKGPGAVSQAELWVAFVEARNRYRRVMEQTGGSGRDLAQALEDMKETYRRWSAA
ncbi:MAG: hypothetical protein HY057_01010 [Rhodospirillales bacterium]|nr:hypothetical protein [Rhodospirillales bacterium]